MKKSTKMKKSSDTNSIVSTYMNLLPALVITSMISRTISDMYSVNNSITRRDKIRSSFRLRENITRENSFVLPFIITKQVIKEQKEFKSEIIQMSKYFKSRI